MLVRIPSRITARHLAGRYGAHRGVRLLYMLLEGRDISKGVRYTRRKGTKRKVGAKRRRTAMPSRRRIVPPPKRNPRMGQRRERTPLFPVPGRSARAGLFPVPGKNAKRPRLFRLP